MILLKITQLNCHQL